MTVKITVDDDGDLFEIDTDDFIIIHSKNNLLLENIKIGLSTNVFDMDKQFLMLSPLVEQANESLSEIEKEINKEENSSKNSSKN